MKNSVLICLFLLLSAPVLAKAGQFTLSSESFTDSSKIPLKYARNGINGGKNISPQLSWKNPPEETKSFALICVDIAPVANNWIHWEVFNIPANIRSIEEGASYSSMPPENVENCNSFGDRGYGGPQPPEDTGVHKYIFTLYALNVEKITPEKEFYNYDEFLKLLNEKIIGQSNITGTFTGK